jgi:hypothetical protein
MFCKISIVTKIKDGALVALVVVSSKYGENIHFSKVGYLWCLGGNKYMKKHSFFQGFLQIWACPIDSKNEYFPGFGWKFHVLQRFPLLPRAGMVAFVVGGSKYGENILFAWFFTGLRMFPLIPKMNIFQFLDGNSCSVRLVGGCKYRENIHFSMVFHCFVYVPMDPFPIFGWNIYVLQ